MTVDVTIINNHGRWYLSDNNEYALFIHIESRGRIIGQYITHKGKYDYRLTEERRESSGIWSRNNAIRNLAIEYRQIPR